MSEGPEVSGSTVPDSGPMEGCLHWPVREWGLKHWPGEGEIGGTRGMVDHGIAHVNSSRSMVKDSGVSPPGSPINAVVDA